MRRWIAVGITLTLLGAIMVWPISRLLERVSRPIVVGILHSQTGAMEISERSMIDAEVLALEEINAHGGLLGRRVKWVIADGRSDWPTFAREAERLIEQEKVSVIFGCWTSASRKSVKPVVEQKSHLLIYPMAYEGLEQSPSIVYTGAAPNQQVIPAVSWCHETLKARKFFLVGSDYVWPHCVHEIAKDHLKALGADCVGESYIPFGSAEVEGAVAAIGKTKPDVIISTVVGESNEPFYRRLEAAGIFPDRTPVLSLSIAEDELRKLPLGAMMGDYAAWNYFQTIDRPENREFIRRFRARYGADRVTSDAIVAAYDSVHLWGQAVIEAGTEDVGEVLKAIRRQSLNAPEGVVSVDDETQHSWRPVYIGRIRGDGQFDIAWSSGTPVRPIPFPASRTRSEWELFLDSLYRAWGGWAPPSAGEGLRRRGGVSGPANVSKAHALATADRRLAGAGARARVYFSGDTSQGNWP
jgi:urea transport system substrate-binding protein